MANHLASNLVTLGVLGGLFIIIYCKIKGTTIGELIRDIKEGLTGE